MQILPSRYNAPFSEPPRAGVHYISLDDQRAMRAGAFDAHVHVYRSLPLMKTIQVFDPLTGASKSHDLGAGFFRPFNSSPLVQPDYEKVFLDQLRKSGVKAASARVNFSPCRNAFKEGANVCDCTAAWRCKCK